MCVRGIVTNTGNGAVTYMCVRVSLPTQESEQSHICVLGVSLSTQESERSRICVLGVSLSTQESEWSCICVLRVSLPTQESERYTNIRDRSLSCVGKKRRGGTFLWAQTPSY
jgi:hypothetical protein